MTRGPVDRPLMVVVDGVRRRRDAITAGPEAAQDATDGPAERERTVRVPRRPQDHDTDDRGRSRSSIGGDWIDVPEETATQWDDRFWSPVGPR